jgi:CheY-like chemotaxis protein
MLAVSDTGIGMDDRTQARIFEPFFTTKPEGKGTGLGLATVYGIVKQSAGHIWVYSEPDHGTTFKIYLPRVDAPADEVPAAPARAATPHGTETILLVEDQEALRTMIRELLEEQGYTVLEAEEGPGALEIARKHAGVIHLLLTDVVMPRMSGRELAKRLASERPECRALYMSGYSNGAISDRGMLLGGTALLEKPFTSEGLGIAVRGALDAPPSLPASSDV